MIYTYVEEKYDISKKISNTLSYELLAKIIIIFKASKEFCFSKKEREED